MEQGVEPGNNLPPRMALSGFLILFHVTHSKASIFPVHEGADWESILGAGKSPALGVLFPEGLFPAHTSKILPSCTLRIQALNVYLSHLSEYICYHNDLSY